MAEKNTDFLRFSAYSIKDLITRKLSEDTKFTDQIYEGSNLATLIDIVSYMYQCLVYQLNNAASESMFSDTQIYENISRLVKFIGYNPKGHKPSVIDIYIYNNGLDDTTVLPLYSYVETGLTDSNGKKICFSTYKQNTESNSDNIQIEGERYHNVGLVNGKWNLYSTIFTSSGTENETFVLDGVYSDSSKKSYIGNDFINVYVLDQNGNSRGSYHADTNELLIGKSRNLETDQLSFNNIYNSSDKVYSVRLNENKEYEIKFGDGITGAKLERGDKVYVLYLETNGPDGEIDVASVDWESLKFKANTFNFSDNEKRVILGLSDQNLLTNESNKKNYYLQANSTNASEAKNEESVEDIRENAPSWFKTGNRLITRADYEYFTKNMGSTVVDVKCMNNWEYLASFYKWLYECGIQYHSDASNPGRYYFQEEKFILNDLQFVDSADANNIYLWVKTLNGESEEYVRSRLVSMGVNNLKTLTTEITVMKSVEIMFDICAAYEEDAKAYLKDGDFDPTGDSYIEITLDDNCIYVNNYIKDRIVQIFKKYFNIVNCRIGQNINNADILDQIYEISGISRVRTVFYPDAGSVVSQSVPRAIDGISLASWTNGFIDLGEDMKVGSTSRHIKEFQFPVFSNIDGVENKIKIVKKQLTNSNSIKF